MRVVFPRIWDADPVLAIAEVLAHQGGWDEALMVIVPLGAFGGLFWIATKRAASQRRDDQVADHGDGPA